MGDRAVIAFAQDAQTSTLNLYMHWGGSDRYTLLADALEASRPRWSDHEYATRICVSQIIGDNWNSELGFGLSVGTQNTRHGEYEPIFVDWSKQRVWEGGPLAKSMSFDEFIEFAEFERARKLHPSGVRF